MGDGVVEVGEQVFSQKLDSGLFIEALFTIGSPARAGYALERGKTREAWGLTEKEGRSTQLGFHVKETFSIVCQQKKKKKTIPEEVQIQRVQVQAAIEDAPMEKRTKGKKKKIIKNQKKTRQLLITKNQNLKV